MPDYNQLSVCHVVNNVGTTSVPAGLAVAQAREFDMDVGILAWFSEQDFFGSEYLEVRLADAPGGIPGASKQSWSVARDMIQDYDIVQTHHNHSGTYAKLIAWRYGKPIVMVEQNNHRGFTRKGRIANSLTNLLADRVVCSSEGVRDSFKLWEKAITSNEKIRVINNGSNIKRVREALDLDWSIREELGLSADSYLVGSAGRLVEQKAQDVLIRAVSDVNEMIDGEVNLVIAGEGQLEDYLRETAAEEGIDGLVHFVGLLDRENLYLMFDQVDVYAMPSRWEGFSGAAIEAMAAGATCVFSDIPELKDAYEGAAKFHPVDDEEALATAIEQLLEDRELREDISEKAWERAERFSVERIARRYQELYREIL